MPGNPPAPAPSRDQVPKNAKAKAPKRVNVAVSPETIEALQRVIDREGVTLTEALRRLVGYGDVIYRAVKEENAEIHLKNGRDTRQVVIL
jgi:hypothetical protein